MIVLLLGVVFHLLPYALAILGDPISLISVCLISLTRVVLFSSLRYRLDSALLGHPLMMVVWAYIMLRSLWLTGVRREIEWRGRTYDASRTKFGAD